MKNVIFRVLLVLLMSSNAASSETMTPLQAGQCLVDAVQDIVKNLSMATVDKYVDQETAAIWSYSRQSYTPAQLEETKLMVLDTLANFVMASDKAKEFYNKVIQLTIWDIRSKLNKNGLYFVKGMVGDHGGLDTEFSVWMHADRCEIVTISAFGTSLSQQLQIARDKKPMVASSR